MADRTHAPQRERPGATRTAFVAVDGTAGAVRRASTVVPDDMALEARARLVRLGVAFAAIAVGVLTLVPFGVLPVQTVAPMAVVAALSLGIAAAGKSETLGHDAALRAALVGLVGYCVVFSFAVARSRYLNFGAPGDSTWTCVLLVAFPLLVPANPRDVAVALCAGALSAPLGVLFVGATTDFEVTLGKLIAFSLSPTCCALIGYWGATYIYRLGEDVRRAQQLGGYTLERFLGGGGMGEVWLAQHARLARPAAIKFIQASSLGPAGAKDTSILERFQREAAATASLRSPHTIEVYDFGVSDEGHFYYAMELLDGMDLEEMVDLFGPLPPARAVAIVLQVLDSLDEAHQAGLLHRDIKPANLFLCRYGLRDDFVKVLDFGLVLRLDDVDARLTQDELAPGTPTYMAPEAAHRPKTVDARADLYAVGCVLYWLLTGRTLFDHDSAMAQMMAHIQEEPPRLRDSLQVPDALDVAVATALEKAPERRFESAAAFAEALREVPLRDVWSAEDARHWWDAVQSEHRPPVAPPAPTWDTARRGTVSLPDTLVD